ncbi:Cyclin-dependent kinases regulatory subunit (Cell division control protein cks1) [Teratosphaeriaceae sp. CCFEE 6253]|nr:Cyclin-dependent kinases regulatory subunit (Cell division control protein cks1) [Teratosphaeriaceae sp. CCFEE 6253]
MALDIDHTRRNKKPRGLTDAERDQLDEFIDAIHYSSRYNDDHYEYRHVQLPKQMLKKIPKDYFDGSRGTLKLLWEDEWRGLGITQEADELPGAALSTTPLPSERTQSTQESWEASGWRPRALLASLASDVLVRRVRGTTRSGFESACAAPMHLTAVDDEVMQRGKDDGMAFQQGSTLLLRSNSIL